MYRQPEDDIPILNQHRANKRSDLWTVSPKKKKKESN